MAIWKVSAKRKFNDGVVKFEPGMEVESVLNSSSTSPSSVYASEKQQSSRAFLSHISSGVRTTVYQLVFGSFRNHR